MTGRLTRIGFVLAFLLQAALLSWMIVGRAMLLANGTEVRLAVVPVDPRDFLRGDYVVLAYDISTLDPAKLAGDDSFNVDDPIYVALVPASAPSPSAPTETAPADPVWQASALYHAYPPDAAGPVLRGRVSGTLDRSGCTQPPCQEYRVDYGLEKFFVPEGEGRALEQLRNDEKLTADIAVGSNGAAVLKRLRVNGDIRYEAGLF
ncbi:GDYXXLXY domain-containing protein [Rhodoligotrophos ferricapiens]|uniref:GDYXXLXY domain-containing protein n=1 Tax=Rhodoligotrophos ferricapiens TaxID=3069264 RepID=UPI00315DD2D6